MDRHNYTVFSEGRISNLVLKNRLVRSATSENSMTTDGKANETTLKIYQNLAAGGSGMIISGFMAVTPSNKMVDKQMCIYSDEYIAEIAKIADVVHQTDSRCVIIAQLCHLGRQVLHHNNSAECIGPSAVQSPILVKTARELYGDEIEIIIKCFADAIVRVKKAGFDGVQLDAAHGYLLSSFLSPYTNRRTDRFGGSVKNRVSIIRDIISLASKEVGGFPILIKINCDDHVAGGISPENFAELITEIEDSGVAAIEVSGGMWDCLARSEQELGFFPFPIPESRTRINTEEKQSYYYDNVKEIDSNLPLILVGGHRNIERMEKILNEGKVDYLSLCRPLIAEPGLPKRWLDGAGSANADCASCNACLSLQEELGCVVKQTGRNKEISNASTQGWKDIFK
ncbi:NADH oxidase [Sporomusa silvacetica DSM 10669]|uniref:NADH oxidase n=1 Tax=Sporomusa silvacetica DSM 10669 TaxID=1123289 RepID=A0ABZ3IS20_9FIRM|nr:NADH:flavin oxidoreductase [Sporomusa silvacetica]OZC20685.1 NADH oxidase [Sporomusa silvacetica DSM 10669]